MDQSDQTFRDKEIKGIYDGSILPVMLKLALPIFAGMFFQLIYNVTDTIWISRIDLNDPSYVGGTGIIFPIIFLGIALSNGILIGISSLVARGIGERNKNIINRTTESGLVIAAVLSLVIIIAGYLFSDSLLSILGAEGDYKLHAGEYFHYIIPVAAIMFFLSVFHGILQGEGLMKYVMISMIISTITNILLDPVFIFIFHLGVKGAAIATGISEIFSLVFIIIIFMGGKTFVKLEWKFSNIRINSIKKISLVGFPQALAQILMAFSFLIFNRIVISIDPNALTAFSICGRFDQIVLMPIFALGAAVVTMIGQNAGRGNFDRVKKIWVYSILSAALAVFIIATFMIIFAENIYSFFSNVDSVVEYSVTQTRIMEYTFIFASIGILSRSFFQGIGFPLPALIITLLRLIIIAVPAMIVYVYVFNLKMYGVWFGLITGNSISALISIFWTLLALKKLRNGSLEIVHT